MPPYLAGVALDLLSLAMTQYGAQILWLRGEAGLSRQSLQPQAPAALRWGCRAWPASSSPHVVPVPMSDPSRGRSRRGVCRLAGQLPPAVVSVDRCPAQGFRVDRYADHPLGVMAKNEPGKAGDDPRHAATRGSLLGRSPADGYAEVAHLHRAGARGVLHRQLGQDPRSAASRCSALRRIDVGPLQRAEYQRCAGFPLAMEFNRPPARGLASPPGPRHSECIR
jgi:hypothetical protein